MVEEYIKDVVAVEVLKPQELTLNASNYTKEYSFGKYLDREVINNLLANIPSDCPKHSVFFHFLWRTGCRVTEAVSVRKEQINFQDGYIEIRWLKSRKYQKRIIPLQEGLRNILWLYCSPLKHDERLFGFSRQNADKIAKKYGFGHCHVLRHSYAVNFIKQSKGARTDLRPNGQKLNTREQLAKVSKVGEGTVERVKFIRDNADEETKTELRI